MMKDRVLFYNDTTLDNHYGSELTSLILKQAIRKYGYLIKEIPVGVPWKPEDLHMISTVIINGEGSFHDDTPRAEYIYSLACYARSLNKRVCLINTLVYNLPSWYDLSVFDLVYTREGDSYSSALETRGELDSDKTQILLDVVFSYNRYPAAKSREGFLVTDSVLPDVAKRLYTLFQDGRENEKVRYIPLVRNNYFDTFYNVLKTFTEVNYVVTGRYHGVCFALMTKTPFVAIESNTPKIHSLLKMFGMEDRVFDNFDDAVNSGKQFIPLDDLSIDSSDMLDQVEVMICKCLRST
jgi:hypothetical protein